MTTGNNLENISYIPSYNLQEGLHKLYSLVINTIFDKFNRFFHNQNISSNFYIISEMNSLNPIMCNKNKFQIFVLCN